jgi:hypothetical protein
MENRHVDREYLDGALRRLVTVAGFQPDGWTHTEVKEYRRLVQCARAAKVDTDLRNMRMLRIEMQADDLTRGQATLSSGRVIGLTFKDSGGHLTVVFELLPRETGTHDD